MRFFQPERATRPKAQKKRTTVQNPREINALCRRACPLLLSLLGACGGEVGLIRVDLVTAPGSDLLARIDRARLELSNPATVVEAERGADGSLVLDLDVVADGQGGLVRLEGFDASGSRIALGLSAPLPIAAVDADISLYVAAPFGIEEAPVALDPARSEVGAAPLPFGAILAGGQDADGAPLAELAIYNVYDHDLQFGLDLPEPRAGMAVAAGATDFVYLMGGRDPDAGERHEAWRFNTRVAPAGAYEPLPSDPALARASASAAYAGEETILVAGSPSVLIELGRARELTGPDSAGGVAVSVLGPVDRSVLIAGEAVGDTGAAIYRGFQLVEVEAPPAIRRRGHGAALLPDTRVLVVGGADESGPLRSAVLYQRAGDSFATLDDLLGTGRTGAAVTATEDVVLVAGGTDAEGTVQGDAELFDAVTLDPLGRLPLQAARTGAVALPLANRQILLAGGKDASGQPVATLELFTPAD